MQKKIALLAAMPEELHLFLEHSEPIRESHWNTFVIYERRFHDREVVIAKTGVGKVLAATLTQHLIDRYGIDCLVFTGLAGALSGDLHRGDIVVSKDLIQHDLDARALGFPRGQIPYTEIRVIEADERLVSIAEQYRSDGHKTVTGRILTGDQFVSNRTDEELQMLKDELHGIAVEMEGAAVGLVCRLSSVPFVVLRTISDHADDGAPESFEQFLSVASHSSFGLVRHLLERL